MIRTILWTLAWIGVAVWTLFALIGFGVVGLLGDVARDASGHVPGFPDELFSAPWIADLFQRAGRLALFLIWLTGVAVIMAVPALVSWFFPRRRAQIAQSSGARIGPPPGAAKGSAVPWGRSRVGGREPPAPR